MKTPYISLGQLFGIPLRLHVTVLWLAVFVGIVGKAPMLFALVVLLCIVMLHELGHAVVAQRYKVKVISITLFPFGGLAQMSVVPEQPEQELAIALAGPGTNFLLALPGAVLLFVMGFPLTSVPAGDDVSLLWSAIWLWVAFNTVIGVFNLLPAFPLDGGRVLRAALVKKMGYLQATETAVRIGRYLAFFMIGAAFFHPDVGFSFAFIAIFIWVMGGRELLMVRLRHMSDTANPLGRMFQFGGQGGGFGNPFGQAASNNDFQDGDDAAEADFQEAEHGPRAPSVQIEGAPGGGEHGFSDEDIQRLEGHHGRMKRSGESD